MIIKLNSSRNLIREYKDYVKWCKSVKTYPIGFVHWKAKKFGFIFDEKKHEYIKII